MLKAVLIICLSLFGQSVSASTVHVDCEFRLRALDQPLHFVIPVERPNSSTLQFAHKGAVTAQTADLVQLFPETDRALINSARLISTSAEMNWLRDPTTNLPIASVSGKYTLETKEHSTLSVEFLALMNSQQLFLKRESVFSGAGRVFTHVKAKGRAVSNIRDGEVACTNLTNN